MIVIRPFFTFGIILLIYPVLIDRGKLTLSILGHYIFTHLSKVTYGIYMLHLPLIGVMRFINIQGRIIVHSDIVIGALNICFMSYVFSGVVTVLYEYPTLSLMKTFVEKNIEKLYRKEEETKLLDKSKD